MLDRFPIDHVGIAVHDLQRAIERYSLDFGFTLELEEDIPSQKTKAAFLKLGNSYIELLTPMDESSLIAKFLATRGEGLHHICFEVPDIRAELTSLKSKGYQLIDESPRTGARHSEIAFIHPKSTGGVLIELCQY